MKKLLLSLGTIASVATPVAAIIACGVKTETPIDSLEEALKTAKTNDISTVKTSTLDTTGQKVAIEKINAAKDMESLQKIYNDLHLVQKTPQTSVEGTQGTTVDTTETQGISNTNAGASQTGTSSVGSGTITGKTEPTTTNGESTDQSATNSNVVSSETTNTDVTAPETSETAETGTTTTSTENGFTVINDDGFVNSPLIENFDINNENAKSVYALSHLDDNEELVYDQFDTLEEVLKVWTEKANEFAVAYLATAGLAGELTTTLNDGVITFDIANNGESIINGAKTYNSIEQMIGDFAKQLSGDKSSKWISKNTITHKYVSGDHTIDSIIYSQAQGLENTIETQRDTAAIAHHGGSYLRDNKELDLLPYAKWAPFGTLVAEFRPGDSIRFIFDKESDLASFTQRVRYDNTSDYDNNMPIANVDEKTIKYQPISIQNGQIMAASVKDYSIGEATSIFTLKVVARNAVDMVFNDFIKPGGHLDAQLLYLGGFKDANGDGLTNFNDVNMIGSFTVDKDSIYTNYNNANYIKEATFVAGYDEVNNILGASATQTETTPVEGGTASGTPVTPSETVDEGFTNATLIENFDISDQEETTKTVSEFSIDDKKFDVTKADELELFVEGWTNTLNNDSDFMNALHTVGGGAYNGLTLKGEVAGDEITISLVDSNGDTSTLPGTSYSGPIDDFGANANKLLGIPEYKTWITRHKFLAGTSTIKIDAIRHDSIDSILYSQANALTNVVDIDHDEAKIESTKATYKRVDQVFDLMSYKKPVTATQELSAEFQEGDSIIFTFNNNMDIASFTQRVKYIDGFGNGGSGLTDDPKTLTSILYKVEGGEIVGYFNVNNGPDQVLFSLVPIAKNSIRLTFKDAIEYDSYAREGQFLVLIGFEDTNKDGQIDNNDVSSTYQFIFDKNRIPSKYYGQLKKVTFISGYDAAKPEVK